MTQPNEKRTEQIAGKLIAYLRAQLNDPTIAYDLPLTQLRGGFETATYQFQLKGVQEPLDRRLVLRVYPENRDPEDAAWESSLLNPHPSADEEPLILQDMDHTYHRADAHNRFGSSNIVDESPSGSAGVPVKAGQLLRYQGVWSGHPLREGPHVLARRADTIGGQYG